MSPLIETIWIILSYGLVTSSVLLSFGRLADMFGRVKLYNFGLVLFTIASFLCSLAQTGTELYYLEYSRHLGRHFLFSNSAAILTDAFDAKERGKALGLNQVSIVIGSALGLVLGGILTETLGWRAIFWVNIPIGIFAIVWSRAKLRELGINNKRQNRLDWKFDSCCRTSHDNVRNNFWFLTGDNLLLLQYLFWLEDFPC